jgi:transposase
MTKDEVLFGYRQALFAEAARTNVSQACRRFGVHRSTYYAWKREVDRSGLEILRPRERRRPRLPNQIGPHLEHRILAFALGHPGFGPRRIAAELARKKWGGIRISEHGVWCVLKRFNLNTRSKRLALIARHADPYERKPEVSPAELHLDASEPGEKVQMDCFYVGRPGGVQGRCLAIHRDRRRLRLHPGLPAPKRAQPSARYMAELAHLVAAESSRK